MRCSARVLGPLLGTSCTAVCCEGGSGMEWMLCITDDRHPICPYHGYDSADATGGGAGKV